MRRDCKRIEILEIAVVAEIDCRTGMDQVGDEEIGIEILYLAQAGVARLYRSRTDGPLLNSRSRAIPPGYFFT
ncbi:MAG: hypothetical protein DMG80_10605 [Acidobacteria bacterium]|nr:MAG: hypothetical protein DMG80_10605 [Acidobacteriota bacterium]